MNDNLKNFFDDPDGFSFGVITQTGYRELENKINEQAEVNRRQFHRWFVGALVAVGLIALCASAGIFGFGIVLDKQKSFTSNLQQFAQDIQQQRRDTIRGSCEDQNQRHDKTTRRLIRAKHAAEKQVSTFQARMKIRNNAEVSLALIDSLVPLQNCDQVVKEATQSD